MRFCSSCGHELGVGRFCTNCGQPIDRTPPPPSGGAHAAALPVDALPAGPLTAGPLTTDPLTTTDERRAARRDAAMTPGPPRTPPSAADTPPPPRFPLYADEAGSGRPPAPGTHAGAAPSYAGADPATTGSGVALSTYPGDWHDDPQGDWGGEREGGLLDRFGEPRTGDRTPEEALAALNAAAAADPHDTRGGGATRVEGRGSRRRTPWLVAVLVVVVVVAALLTWLGTRDDDPTTADDPAQDTPAAVDQAGTATVDAPRAAPDSRETDGDTATFDATNMLDGDPTTAWRTAGDAKGEEIVFTFPQPVVVSQVGLINGYAKTAVDADGKELDWYHGNRTITKVAWAFDDDTLLEQPLDRDRRMQTLDVADITTTSVTLRLLTVSKPGTGRASRDFTAVSDVTLAGTPAS